MPIDVLVVTIGATAGWRAAAQELAASIERAGASARIAATPPPPRVRTFALTDLVEARLGRRAAQQGIAEHRPRAIVYLSITAALLWPRPGAIWLDSVAAENRPGRHGVWQRAVERRRLRQAPLLLPWSERTLAPARGNPGPPAITLPFPIQGEPAAPDRPRDIDALTYAGDPEKRRLELVLQAWQRARRDGERLVVAGTDRLAPEPGIEVVGRLSAPEFHALLQRAKVFISAPRREDFGISALEALAHGCQLVTTPAPGPYPALDIARGLDARLVSPDLPVAIRAALDDPSTGYAERAVAALEPFRPAAFDRAVAERVLPRLLPG